jgi:hypothetical protein
MPQRIDATGRRNLAVTPRALLALGGLAAGLLALSSATAPVPVRAASVLSDGSASPASGTTTTPFVLTVHYASSDHPRPAQEVWAEVGGLSVPLLKVSGTAHDGTWQGTSTLPAGTWQVTFNAKVAGDSPQPLLGPILTVTAPPPTPPPPPPPPPTAAPTPPPTDAIQPTSSPSLIAGASGSAQGRSQLPAPSPTDGGITGPGATPGSAEPPADDADAPPGSRFASLLIVGGTMSLAGAALLARQWHVRGRARWR